MRTSAIFLIGLLLLILNDPAMARTWYVERDGSGDYSVIQEAVNVAASGDTIQIGPGRFDEKELVTYPGWSEYVRVHVEYE